MSINKSDKFEGKKREKPIFQSHPIRMAILMAILKIVSPVSDAKAEDTSCKQEKAVNPTDKEPCYLDIGCKREMDRYHTTAEFGQEELKLLQNCQETLYRFYLNPSFLLYVERTEKQEKADKALELVIQYPDQLHYREEASGVFTITRRDEAKNIPDHFSMRIEFDQLVEINGMELNPLGWLDWEKFEKTIPKVNRKILANRRNQRRNELANQGNQRRDKKDRDQDIYDTYRINLPHRLARLIQLRGNLNPEVENTAVNPGYSRFLGLLEQHPQSRKEHNRNLQIVKEGGEQPEKTVQFFIATNKHNPGVFVIKVPTDNGSFEPILGVSKEGYLMEAVGHKEGFVIWALPDGYKNAIAERQKQCQ